MYYTLTFLAFCCMNFDIEHAKKVGECRISFKNINKEKMSINIEEIDTPEKFEQWFNEFNEQLPNDLSLKTYHEWTFSPLLHYQ